MSVNSSAHKGGEGVLTQNILDNLTGSFKGWQLLCIETLLFLCVGLSQVSCLLFFFLFFFFFF